MRVLCKQALPCNHIPPFLVTSPCVAAAVIKTTPYFALFLCCWSSPRTNAIFTLSLVPPCAMYCPLHLLRIPPAWACRHKENQAPATQQLNNDQLSLLIAATIEGQVKRKINSKNVSDCVPHPMHTHTHKRLVLVKVKGCAPLLCSNTTCTEIIPHHRSSFPSSSILLLPSSGV